MELPEINGKVIVNGYEHEMLIIAYKSLQSRVNILENTIVAAWTAAEQCNLGAVEVLLKQTFTKKGE